MSTIARLKNFLQLRHFPLPVTARGKTPAAAAKRFAGLTGLSQPVGGWFYTPFQVGEDVEKPRTVAQGCAQLWDHLLRLGVASIDLDGGEYLYVVRVIPGKLPDERTAMTNARIFRRRINALARIEADLAAPGPSYAKSIAGPPARILAFMEESERGLGAANLGGWRCASCGEPCRAPLASCWNCGPAAAPPPPAPAEDPMAALAASPPPHGLTPAEVLARLRRK